MVTSYGKALGPAEAAEFGGLDLSGIDAMLAEMPGSQDAREGLKPSQPLNDRIVLYHPDPKNPSSVYVVPKNANDRKQKLLALMSKRVERNGKLVQWNNPTPVVEAADLPLRCFVSNCSRAGGLATRADLIAHVQGKHTNEAPLYQRLIDKLMEQVYLDLPDAEFEKFGITPPERESVDIQMGSAPLVERKPAKGVSRADGNT